MRAWYIGGAGAPVKVEAPTVEDCGVVWYRDDSGTRYLPVPPGSRVQDGRLIEVPGPADRVLLFAGPAWGYRGVHAYLVDPGDGFWDECASQRQPPDWDAVMDAARSLPEDWLLMAADARASCSGRSGWGTVYVLRVPLPAGLLVARWGRLYGAPQYVRVFLDPPGEVRLQPAYRAAEERASVRALGG